MRRRTQTVIAIASLSLCAMTVALWIRSWAAADEIAWQTPRFEIRALSNSGRVLLGYSDVGHTQHHLVYERHGSHANFGWEPTLLNRAGFGLRTQSKKQGQVWAPRWQPDVQLPALINFGHVMFPFWLVALLLLAVAIRSPLRRRRLAETGRCAECGYDLRATPDRCPECGVQVE